MPKYISVFRECTDEPQYQSEAMCKEEYAVNQNDKTGTSPVWRNILIKDESYGGNN